MSPLIAAPSRGYADYQRLDNYDSGVLWSEASPGNNVQVVSPIMDMSRYLSIGGSMQCTGGVCEVDIRWFADAAATVPLGDRIFWLTSAVGQQMQLRIPNLGPFLQVTIQNVQLGAFTVFATIIGTNRPSAIDIVPAEPWLVDVQSATLTAGNTFGANPNNYYAGPVQVWVLCSQTCVVQLQVLNPQGVYDPAFELAPAGANVDQHVNLITPTGVWRLAVISTAGASGTLDIYIIPSATGSS